MPETKTHGGDKYVPQPVLNVLRSAFFGGNLSKEHTPADRRKSPTFLLPAEPPSWGPAFEKASFRSRVKGWNDSIVGDLNAFPYIVFVYYTFKIWLFIWLFMNKIANPNVGFFDEDNVKRNYLQHYWRCHRLQLHGWTPWVSNGRVFRDLVQFINARESDLSFNTWSTRQTSLASIHWVCHLRILSLHGFGATRIINVQ